MTTIAYRDGVLASDATGRYGSAYESGRVAKVKKTKDGRLLAWSGLAAPLSSYAHELAGTANGQMPTRALKEDDGRVIEVFPSGKIVIHEMGGKYSLGKPKFGAWGTGSDAALGALHMGADAVTAVRVGIKVDSNSGPGVRSVRLGK